MLLTSVVFDFQHRFLTDVETIDVNSINVNIGFYKTQQSKQPRISLDLTWFNNVPTSTRNGNSSSSHWSWKITSSIQAATSLISLGFVGSAPCSPASRICTRSKKNRKHSKASNQGSTPNLTWFSNVPTSTRNDSSSSSHWSWKITSSIQATTSLIYLGFSFSKPLSISQLSFSIELSLFFFLQKLSLYNMIKSIYTLVASSRDKAFPLVPSHQFSYDNWNSVMTSTIESFTFVALVILSHIP